MKEQNSAHGFTEGSEVPKEQDAAHSSLSPCPFCGSQPEWINETIPDGHFYIRCPHCHIVMKEDRRDKVIGMWNHRAELTRLRSELQQLQSALDHCKEVGSIRQDLIAEQKSELQQGRARVAELKKEIERLTPIEFSNHNTDG